MNNNNFIELHKAAVSQPICPSGSIATKQPHLAISLQVLRHHSERDWLRIINSSFVSLQKKRDMEYTDWSTWRHKDDLDRTQQMKKTGGFGGPGVCHYESGDWLWQSGFEERHSSDGKRNGHVLYSQQGQDSGTAMADASAVQGQST